MNKHYDYLVVGAGLYGAVFAHEAQKAGKSVLVIDKRPNIAGNVYTEDIEKIHVHKKSGIISLSLRNLTVLQTARWPIITENFIHFHLICTHSIKCGAW